jgi:ATP phosphoribosyltransferase regulatory subunit
LKILARLAHRHGEHPTSAVLAPAGNDPELLRAIESLRRDRRVIQLLGSECASETYGCSHRLACADGTWQVVEI